MSSDIKQNSKRGEKSKFMIGSAPIPADILQRDGAKIQRSIWTRFNRFQGIIWYFRISITFPLYNTGRIGINFTP